MASERGFTPSITPLYKGHFLLLFLAALTSQFVFMLQATVFYRFPLLGCSLYYQPATLNYKTISPEK